MRCSQEVPNSPSFSRPFCGCQGPRSLSSYAENDAENATIWPQSGAEIWSCQTDPYSILFLASIGTRNLYHPDCILQHSSVKPLFWSEPGICRGSAPPKADPGKFLARVTVAFRSVARRSVVSLFVTRNWGRAELSHR